VDVLLTNLKQKVDEEYGPLRKRPTSQLFAKWVELAGGRVKGLSKRAGPTLGSTKVAGLEGFVNTSGTWSVLSVSSQRSRSSNSDSTGTNASPVLADVHGNAANASPASAGSMPLVHKEEDDTADSTATATSTHSPAKRSLLGGEGGYVRSDTIACSMTRLGKHAPPFNKKNPTTSTWHH
jgi:hypothetical protein